MSDAKKFRRHFKRFETDGSGIQCRIASAGEALLLGLVPAGAYVLVKETLDEERNYVIHLEREGLHIMITGYVVNSKASIDASLPGYIVAMKLLKPFLTSELNVIEFIKSHALKGTEDKPNALKVKVTGEDLSSIAPMCPVARVSFGGLQMQTLEPHDVNARLRMELLLSEGAALIKFTGRIASCKPIADEAPVVYEVGVEFVEMEMDDLLKLKHFIYLIQEHEAS